MKHYIFIALTLLISGTFHHSIAQEKTIPEFIRDNPDKSSIYLVVNGEVQASVNPDRMMPLASTVKIIVAIEYAYQAASGKVNPAQLVDTSILNHYYIPNTDGGAQPGWINYVQKKGLLNEGKTSLEEVAKGMINFSSNANTEYLIDLLGLDNINKRIKELSLKDHDDLYYFISSLMLIHDKKANEIEAISKEEYVEKSNEWHEKLKEDKSQISNVKNIPFNVQKIWSDRLTKSTTRTYADIMQKINSGTYFSKDVQRNIATTMEAIMENPANEKWLEHAGTKGGSTTWVLTKAMYATKKDGTTIEIAYFFDNLSLQEQMKLQKSLNSFELALLTNKDGIRDEIIKLLN